MVFFWNFKCHHHPGGVDRGPGLFRGELCRVHVWYSWTKTSAATVNIYVYMKIDVLMQHTLVLRSKEDFSSSKSTESPLNEEIRSPILPWLCICLVFEVGKCIRKLVQYMNSCNIFTIKLLEITQNRTVSHLHRLMFYRYHLMSLYRWYPCTMEDSIFQRENRYLLKCNLRKGRNYQRINSNAFKNILLNLNVLSQNRCNHGKISDEIIEKKP